MEYLNKALAWIARNLKKGIALADAYCKRLVEVLSDERLWSVPV